MRYGLYIIRDGVSRPEYIMMNEDEDYLQSMGEYYVAMNFCDEFFVEQLSVGVPYVL
jgi:hypothetical protein